MDSMISILFTGLLSSSTRYFSSGVLLIQMDRAEAILAGEEAVRAACAGESGKMVGFIRESASPYKVRTTLIDVHDVMLVEKKMPDAYINEAGNGVNHQFIEYALPLIQGEPELPKQDSLPRFAKLKKILAK